ncbi:hypothetical protein HNP86_001988 [Methanococcus maripaludis]|uniref:Uncharacterized protein n=1 Tax=Methanococcus maripaludis TaxID=39152 RepID=A0A7J9NVW9_METMI|nr:hypothetical protein [Methanococcus maripaludis]MBA2851829.1 hypothetical protein [Methanococcus maripaludis]
MIEWGYKHTETYTRLPNGGYGDRDCYPVEPKKKSKHMMKCLRDAGYRDEKVIR